MKKQFFLLFSIVFGFSQIGFSQTTVVRSQQPPKITPCQRAANSLADNLLRIKNSKVSLSLKKQRVLMALRNAVSRNRACACELVKITISSTNFGKEFVGLVVRTAILAAPEEAIVISRCAQVADPLAYNEIIAAYSQLTGDQSPILSDPTQFPGDNQNPDTTGGGLTPPSGVGGTDGGGGGGFTNQPPGPFTTVNP